MLSNVEALLRCLCGQYLPIFSNIVASIFCISPNIVWSMLGTYQKLAGGKGEWKTGEGLSFFEPLRREGYEKNDRKRGRVTRN